MRPAGRDEERMQSAVEANAADLLRYLERRTSSPEDAADLLSDCLLTAWRRVRDLPEHDEKVRMWLFVIARNGLANYRRGNNRRHRLAERLRGEIELGQRQLASGPDEADAIRDEVEALPDHLRELVTLVHWDGFSLTEAADIIGINPSTARSRYSTAKERLRDRIRTSPVAPQVNHPSKTVNS